MMQSPSQSDQKESQTSKASDDQVYNTSPVLKPEKVSKTDPHAFPLRKKRLCKPWDENSVTLPSKSDGKTSIFTRIPTVSSAGSSRDTAEETSARYYNNYIQFKRRIADYDSREQFTDTDSDDCSFEHCKREADRRRRRLMDKEGRLCEWMRHVVADIDSALKELDDCCDDLPREDFTRKDDFTRKPTFSLEGSSRDTAEETSARYYQYLRCKRLLAITDYELRKPFTDTDSDDTTRGKNIEHYKREADGRYRCWMDKEVILYERMRESVYGVDLALKMTNFAEASLSKKESVKEDDPVPSSAFTNPMATAAGASIPLPPSVTTKCASASLFPFSGSTRPYVSSSLKSINMQGSSSIANPTAAGVAGPSNNNSAQNDLRRDVSGPPTAAGTSFVVFNSKASSSSGNDFEISCPICCDTLMDIKERREHLVSTVCGHVFCEVCLDEAVRRTQQCPTCRRRLTKRQFHKLFI
ncbi:hypothetical protein HAZT_HAZT003480 [Hyalella azteca]|nr:hypothetical protein HAZT_HAZT003480 [Hyalella azteca]